MNAVSMTQFAHQTHRSIRGVRRAPGEAVLAAARQHDRRCWIACTERPSVLLSLRSVGRSVAVILGILNRRPACSPAPVVFPRPLVVAPLLPGSHLPPGFAVLLPPAQLALAKSRGALSSSHVTTLPSSAPTLYSAFSATSRFE